MLAGTEDLATAATVETVAGRRDKAGSDETFEERPSTADAALLKSAVFEVVEPAMPPLRIHFQRDSTCRPRLIERQPGKARELQTTNDLLIKSRSKSEFFLRTCCTSHSAVTFQPQPTTTDDGDL